MANDRETRVKTVALMIELRNQGLSNKQVSSRLARMELKNHWGKKYTPSGISARLTATDPKSVELRREAQELLKTKGIPVVDTPVKVETPATNEVLALWQVDDRALRTLIRQEVKTVLGGILESRI